MDCKKKELVGGLRNSGAERAHKGSPVEAPDHDFPLPGLGKAAPYGVHDVGGNEGFADVGTGPDTAQFAAAPILAWREETGEARHRGARRLPITCDGGGSNGARNRLWKAELQRPADRTGLEIEVCHLPPGTSKWNKTEHRMPSQITLNRRGRPLTSIEVIVSLTASTTTETGLTTRSRADTNHHPKGIKVTDEEYVRTNIHHNEFQPQRNHATKPQNT